MTKEEIKNTPELVDFMLDECVLADSRAKVRKRLEEICDIAVKALEQEPKVKKIIKMRDATPEERESIYKYIKSISKPTGVNFFDLEQQPCEDAVSRQAVIDVLRTCYDTETKEYSDGSQWINYEDTVAEMENLPSVTPQQKTGHWIVNKKVDTAYDISGYKSWAISYACEHCGFIHQAIENHGVYSYCPNCGAKMVEPQESEVQDADSD